MSRLLALGLIVVVGCADEGPEPVVLINEVVSDNLTGDIDEAGESDDWIELHNPSDDAIDLGGWSLRDEFGESEPWTLADGLTVGPGGYELLWLDGTPEQGDAHGPFDLSRDGAVLVLLDADGVLIQDVRTGMIDPDMSFARVPDGGETWRYLHEPTPQGPND